MEEEEESKKEEVVDRFSLALIVAASLNAAGENSKGEEAAMEGRGSGHHKKRKSQRAMTRRPEPNKASRRRDALSRLSLLITSLALCSRNHSHWSAHDLAVTPTSISTSAGVKIEMVADANQSVSVGRCSGSTRVINV